jgi:hypothetical protein
MSRRFPHACGDGPKQMETLKREHPFSPRVWGWSDHRPCEGNRCQVFPTRVGMVRPRRGRSRSRTGFPHACGDGPNAVTQAGSINAFSPRVWGLSAVEAAVERPYLVFPTRVGMVRRRRLPRCSPACFPHACGDGPDKVKAIGATVEFSPTRVGMVRIARGLARCRSSFPHACGDGPLPRGWPWASYTFSPRVWGWSDEWLLHENSASVFPTRVGMVRTRTQLTRPQPCFPHVRGDGPIGLTVVVSVSRAAVFPTYSFL